MFSESRSWWQRELSTGRPETRLHPGSRDGWRRDRTRVCCPGGRGSTVQVYPFPRGSEAFDNQIPPWAPGTPHQGLLVLLRKNSRLNGSCPGCLLPAMYCPHHYPKPGSLPQDFCTANRHLSWPVPSASVTSILSSCHWLSRTFTL